MDANATKFNAEYAAFMQRYKALKKEWTKLRMDARKLHEFARKHCYTRSKTRGLTSVNGIQRLFKKMDKLDFIAYS